MSISGSGRFRNVYGDDFSRDLGRFSARSGAYHPNGMRPSMLTIDPVTPVNFEPGTGAEFMYHQGWHDRDAYGKPRDNLAGRREPPSRFRNRLSFNCSIFDREHRTTLILSVALAIVTLLLLALVVVLIVLFATGVFVTRHNCELSLEDQQYRTTSSYPTSPLSPLTALPTTRNTYGTTYGTTNGNGNSPQNRPSSTYGTSLQPRQTSPEVDYVQRPQTPAMNVDSIVSRNYDIQFYVNDQANSVFDNQSSFEYVQAYAMIQNALASVIGHSTLRDFRPVVTISSLTNKSPDLLATAQLRLTLPSRSSVNAVTVKSVLLSELQLLESELNGSTVDRSRLSVTTR